MPGPTALLKALRWFCPLSVYCIRVARPNKIWISCKKNNGFWNSGLILYMILYVYITYRGAPLSRYPVFALISLVRHFELGPKKLVLSYLGPKKLVLRYLGPKKLVLRYLCPKKQLVLYFYHFNSISTCILLLLPISNMQWMNFAHFSPFFHFPLFIS